MAKRLMDTLITVGRDYFTIVTDKKNINEIKHFEGISSVFTCNDGKYIIDVDPRYSIFDVVLDVSTMLTNKGECVGVEY